MVAKAFTDPTYLCRTSFSWISLTTPSQPKITYGYVYATCLPRVVTTPVIFGSVKYNPNPITLTFMEQVLVPPMGKLSVMTLPAVYKAQTFRSTVGQVYPRGNR